MSSLKFLFLFIVLSITSCKPEDDVPSKSKKIYKMVIKFMEDSSEPPPIVKEYIDKKLNDSLYSE